MGSAVKQRIYGGKAYGGSFAGLAALKLLMPFAARAFEKMEYDYDEDENKAVFLQSAGQKVYCPEKCRVYPMGSGEALLSVEAADNKHEWFVSGIPALDNFQEGQELETGAILGEAAQDLLIGLDLYPHNGGRVGADPLTVLQDGKAQFPDIASGAILDGDRRRPEGQRRVDPEPEPAPPEIVPPVIPATSSELLAPPPPAPLQSDAAVSAAMEIFKSKPQFTASDMMIAVGVTSSLTALITWGLTRRRRRY